MIVLDASAMVELLMDTDIGRAVAERIFDSGVPIHVPHLVDLEVAQALRRYVRAGLMDPGRAALALDDLRAFAVSRHAHAPLVDRVWELRDNLTAHDACYVALAEGLDAVLITCDRALARAPGVTARIECLA